MQFDLLPMIPLSFVFTFGMAFMLEIVFDIITDPDDKDE